MLKISLKVKYHTLSIRRPSTFSLQTAITCPAVTKPTDGKEPVCTNSNNFDSVCTFECNDGFALVGSATLKCGGDGTSPTGSFDNPEPTCQGW